MFFPVNAVLVSGAVFAGIKAIRLCKKRLSSKYETSGRDISLHAGSRLSQIRLLAENAITHSRTMLDRIDDQYQHFMMMHFDRILGRPVNQYLNNDSGEDIATRITPEEKKTNRDVALCASATVIAWSAGQSVFSLLFTIPVSIYLLSRVYKISYQALVKERRLKLEALWAVYGTVALASGYIGIMCFSLTLGFLSSKLILVTQARSRNKIVDVFGQQPDTVWTLVNGTEVEVLFTQLQPGDIVVVNAGQAIPVDGKVVYGMGAVDQHTLTGEAQPAEKTTGDPAFATTVLLSGKLHIQVEKRGKDSVAAQIGLILNKTAGYQLALESKGIEIADRTILPRLLLSALALPVSGVNGATGVLGCGMGTNLRFSSPVAMLNFLNRASDSGILVKDGRSLEVLNDIDTIVFDKTGTLTSEQPYVSQIHILVGVTEEELIYYAAAAEYRQTHPVARAILAAAEERHIILPEPDQAQIAVGYGIQAIITGKTIHIGSHRYMLSEHIRQLDEMQSLQMQCQAAGNSLVFVAIDGQLVGAMELQPTVRPEVQEVTRVLYQQGYRLVIISGDQEEPTRKVAEQLGISHYHANTLPENKADLIRQLQESGRSVCFIGDGINDAIALKQANVSVSLSGATTVATDTAQIVLVDPNLQQLVRLFILANNFNTNMQRSFTLAIAPGALFIGGVFFFHWGIYGSVIAHTISLCACIGNAILPASDTGRMRFVTEQKPD